LGWVLGAVFVATGSLVIPIIIHTFIDLKFYLIPKSVVESA
jgi:membrane protease YdiL (CAAX protease family)